MLFGIKFRIVVAMLTSHYTFESPSFGLNKPATYTYYGVYSVSFICSCFLGGFFGGQICFKYRFYFYLKENWEGSFKVSLSWNLLNVEVLNHYLVSTLDLIMVLSKVLLKRGGT